jgi:type IV secretory pathway VirB2 component (pilin)
VLYVLALVVVVVGVDVLFFRHHFAERLLVNIGIVLAFAAVYLGLLKRRRAQPPQSR